jgi:hypothetical protein
MYQICRLNGIGMPNQFKAHPDPPPLTTWSGFTPKSAQIRSLTGAVENSMRNNEGKSVGRVG